MVTLTLPSGRPTVPPTGPTSPGLVTTRVKVTVLPTCALFGSARLLMSICGADVVGADVGEGVGADVGEGVGVDVGEGVGDMQLAVQLAVEALAINLGLGERQGVAASLVCLAQVADAQAQTEVGVRMLGKADAFVAPMGLQLLPFDREQHELISRRLRSQVDVSRWEAAWEAGRGLSLDEATQAAEAVGTSARAAAELTERQRGILRLVAAGQTNREHRGSRSSDATLYAVRSGLIRPMPAAW
jgi:hypothetical protein